jgi:hypothetical protein
MKHHFCWIFLLMSFITGAGSVELVRLLLTLAA